MAFTVSTTFDNIEVVIPAADGEGSVTLSLPPLDCFSPKQVDAINKALEKNPKAHANGAEALRTMLLSFAAEKHEKAAISALWARQLTEIDEYWQKESGMKVGESSPSTDS
ncbi:hypothetical protein ACKFR8_05070 [Corynebacterium axilliensis]|uniref:hypothetical protein n=1 Tax=Corynebacterium sp. YSMAA5_1_F9 TaxID=3383591 RepID=UPI0038D177B7